MIDYLHANTRYGIHEISALRVLKIYIHKESQIMESLQRACESRPQSRMSLKLTAQKSVPNISFCVILVNMQPQYELEVSQRLTDACITFLLLFSEALSIVKY